jgi:hypothetical protein
MTDAKSYYFKPEFGIPHTLYRQTDKGFVVCFRRTSEFLYKRLHPREGYPKATDNAYANLFLLAFLIAFIGFWLFWWVVDLFMWTVIVVNGREVRISRRRIPRADFGHFGIHHTLARQEHPAAVLGYSYGNRRRAFGGVWPQHKAEEVAAALNNFLALTPIDDDQRTSQDELRRRGEPKF